MPDVSGRQLSELTGKTWRTVKSRLDAAGLDPARRVRNADLYESTAALAAIYAPDARGDDDAATLTAERARLAKEQADRTALDNATRRGELVEMAVVAEEWSRYFQAFRERFIGFPVKVAAELAALTGGDADTIRGRLDGEVEECLAAFHRAGGSAADDSPDARRARGRSPAAAAAVNGQRVGRPKAPTEPRKQRRTGAVAD